MLLLLLLLPPPAASSASPRVPAGRLLHSQQALERGKQLFAAAAAAAGLTTMQLFPD
jgi:hypothetical protein